MKENVVSSNGTNFIDNEWYTFVSNEKVSNPETVDKEIDDELVAENVIEARRKHHNKPTSKSFDIYVGLNVFLRNDKAQWQL